MKTKTVHTVAICLLFVMSIINIYADAKHRHGVIERQINANQNLMESNTALLELKVTLDELPIFFKAINRNQLALKSILPSVSALQIQVAELLEHTNYKIEESNKEFLKKLREAKTCDFSNNGSPLAPGCLPA